MPNSAAYKRADVEDARRGHPAVDLTGHAQARALELVGQQLIGHVGGLNPLWQDYVFNAMRGELVPGRFGTLQHELHEVGLGDDGDPVGGGRYFGVRARTRMTWRSFLPLGELFEKQAPNEPFAAQSVWLPTTGVKVLVPEAALLPRVRIVTADFASFTEPSFAGGCRLIRTDSIGADLQAALEQHLGPIVAGLRGAFTEVILKNGQLGLRVDGFRADPADLDALVAAVGSLAEALVRMCEVTHVPEPPFTDPLPPFDRATHPVGYRSFDGQLDNSGFVALQTAAADLGLRVEDPAALHRAFPTLPVPGRSLGVLAGPIPGSQAFGRLTWNDQAHPGSSAYLRRAVITAAAPGAATRPGGIFVPSSDMWVAAVDGLASAWCREYSLAKLDAPGLAERALAALRETGAAEV